MGPGADGIVFARSDGAGAVRASWRNVVVTRLATVLAADGVEVRTVEHLMSALAALGITDAVIRVDGPEVPILDGSAAPFRTALAEVAEPTGAAPVVKVLRAVSVAAKGAFAALIPSTGRCFDVAIDFEDAAIGLQRVTFDLDRGDYASEVAPARTFGRVKDIDAMRRRGYGRGASLANAVAVDGSRVVNPEGLRMADEFARHKLLDAIGDMALAERPILGLYRSHKAGHRLNYALLRRLFASRENFQLLPN